MEIDIQSEQRYNLLRTLMIGLIELNTLPQVIHHSQDIYLLYSTQLTILNDAVIST